MSEASRRGFIAATGAGVAGVAVATTASSAEAVPEVGAAQEEVVAHVRDHRLSEVRILVGEREVVVHDRDLVTRILNAAGRR